MIAGRDQPKPPPSAPGLRVVVLGCGASGGVPVVGGGWGSADPREPRNRRRRVSVYVAANPGAGQGGSPDENRGRILVDTSPDLREQLIDAGIDSVDAVLWTHAHADHLHGIDDLRGLNKHMGRRIAVWGDADTLSEIGRRFDYVFAPQPPGSGFFRPALDPYCIPAAPGTRFAVGPLKVQPFAQDHGFGMRTLGFRIGGFAYSTDVKTLPEAAFAVLQGIHTWVVDCQDVLQQPTHSHLQQTLGWIERFRPKRAVLTHMSHASDYRTLAALCPPGVEPAYDGMILEVPAMAE